jgi:hypothetical protein
MPYFMRGRGSGAGMPYSALGRSSRTAGVAVGLADADAAALEVAEALALAAGSGVLDALGAGVDDEGAAALVELVGLALGLSDVAVGVAGSPQATRPDIASASAIGAMAAELARSAPQKGQRESPVRTCRSQAWQGVRAMGVEG